MSTMLLDLNYFANNNGLCDIQIRLSCLEEDEDGGLPLPPPPLPPTKK